jgi:hypothetical protein
MEFNIVITREVLVSSVGLKIEAKDLDEAKEKAYAAYDLLEDNDPNGWIEQHGNTHTDVELADKDLDIEFHVVEFWYVVQCEGLVVAGPYTTYDEASKQMDWIMDRQVGSFDVESSSKVLDEGDKLEESK